MGITMIYTEFYHVKSSIIDEEWYRLYPFIWKLIDPSKASFNWYLKLFKHL